MRYDIFGSGVLVANKIEHHGIAGRLSISEATRKILLSQPDIANEYTMTPHISFTLASINKVVNTYFIERKEDNHSMLSSDHSHDDLGSFISKSECSTHSKRSNQILIEPEESEDD